MFDGPEDAGAAPLSDLERERVAQFLLGEIVAGHRDQGLATDRSRELAGARRWARENPATAAMVLADISEVRARAAETHDQASAAALLVDIAEIRQARAPQPEASA